MHQQCLGRVAHRHPLGLGVEDDRQRLVEIRVDVDVHMAVTDPGLDHGHGGLRHHRTNQTGPAPRDQHIHKTAQPHELLDGLVVGTGHERDRVGGQPSSGRCLPQHRDQRGVGTRGRRAAAQQHGVTALETQPSRVHRHVRTRLVDDPDHAERHPDLAQLYAVGKPPTTDHLADRVVEGRHLA